MLQLQSVSAGYGRSDVIHGISIDIAKNTLVSLIGSNGAGKTTTMRAISGMIRLSCGTITLAGKTISGRAAHEIAYVGLAHAPEGRRTFASMSVRDNLRLGAYRRPARDAAAIQRDMDFVMSVFPRLAERHNQTAGTLSGGEQQMLALGRALMADPKVILLDEPSLGLAPKLVADVYQIIRQLKNEGRTMLLVEQFANLALAVSDTAYVMENGKIVLEGKGADLLEDPRVRDAYIG